MPSSLLNGDDDAGRSSSSSADRPYHFNHHHLPDSNNMAAYATTGSSCDVRLPPLPSLFGSLWNRFIDRSKSHPFAMSPVAAAHPTPASTAFSGPENGFDMVAAAALAATRATSTSSSSFRHLENTAAVTAFRHCPDPLSTLESRCGELLALQQQQQQQIPPSPSHHHHHRSRPHPPHQLPPPPPQQHQLPMPTRHPGDMNSLGFDVAPYQASSSLSSSSPGRISSVGESKNDLMQGCLDQRQDFTVGNGDVVLGPVDEDGEDEVKNYCCHVCSYNS